MSAQVMPFPPRSVFAIDWCIWKDQMIAIGFSRHAVELILLRAIAMASIPPRETRETIL
jgi:hypothetical protein